MLQKAFAALLLLLAASPFTAPFATCDVSTLFGGHPNIADTRAAFVGAPDDQPTTVALEDASSRTRKRVRIVGVDAHLPSAQLSLASPVVTPLQASCVLRPAVDRTPPRPLRI